VRFLLTVAALLVVVASSTACPGPEYPKCENDDQCKKKKVGDKEVKIDEFCVFGQCQECAKDTNCDEGERCKKGRCEAECTADDQCGSGRICHANECRAAECDANKGCADGKSCSAGRCVTPTSTNTGGTGGTTSGGGGTCERQARVGFDFNVYDLRPEGRETLDSFARCLRDNPAWRLTVEGHADERGTTEYNLQLGEKRASTIRDYLVKLGVDKGRIKAISYGEEKPASSGADEGAWAQNRRGELIVQ
jgi:peptidoglycan-associated lipoprotein